MAFVDHNGFGASLPASDESACLVLLSYLDSGLIKIETSGGKATATGNRFFMFDAHFVMVITERVNRKV
jgi:hypothetical protein